MRPQITHHKAQYYLRKGVFHGLKTFAEFEHRIEHLLTEAERGAVFEVFAEAYLHTQPIVRSKKIWSEKAIPYTYRKKLGLTSRDMGADGVILTTADQCWVYQVKFRSRRAPLTWEEASTFFGISDRADQRLLFTNTDDISAVMGERKDSISIRGHSLDTLTASDFAAIEAFLIGKPVRIEKKQPRPHQRKALQAIIPALRKGPRATAIMACGTGKTQVGLWTAEALANHTVLVLVPSLALLRQTLLEWIKQTKWKDLDYLCVCSDPTVSQGGDELIVRPAELEFPVTTDPGTVRTFLGAKSKGVKVVFSTYQSAKVVAKGMDRSRPFDFAVLDEAHKTAGREGASFAFALQDKNLPIRKRLFLTATPRHYNVAKRDEEGEPLEVFSMNRPEIYGPVVFNLGFAEAAKLGIICNYKVIISVVMSRMITRSMLQRSAVVVKGQGINAPQVANQLAITRAIRKHQVSKVFTFHRSVASARSFTSEEPEGIGTHLPSFGRFHVNGAMPTAHRDGIMQEFRNSRKAVMSNARCLTEGIDVPAVDMVAFMSPKKSRVDIVQAVGRAMRRAPNKSVGYILVPLYLEQGGKEPLQSALEKTDFQEVWAVLQAMQEQDQILDYAIHDIRADIKLKKKGFDDLRFRERIEILGPAISLSRIRLAIATRCIDRLGRPWQTMVQLLLKFKKKYGHTNVPRKPRAPWADLGRWVDDVRALSRNRHLSAEREAELNTIGFNWRIEGQTLDDTNCLLNEQEFKEQSGLFSTHTYRKRGLIKPVGWALAGPSISAFYHPRQIGELEKKLGITLKTTTGLLNESEFARRSGFSSVSKYRKRGLIRPVGWAMAGPGLSPFYYPRQIKELRKKLGITLEKTTGLLNELEFKNQSGFTNVHKYRRRGLIQPAGWALAGGVIGAFYHPRQIAELKKRLGITLKSTTGLLNESEFARRSGLTSISSYRKRGLIKPVGWALAGPHISAFYHPRQIAELKKRLGFTLQRVTGLINERQFIKRSGFWTLAKYRKRGLIKPVGWALAGPSISAFYHPRQIGELEKKLGITLKTTTGLLNESEFARRSGFSSVSKYRKRGLIRPVGWAMAGPGLSAFYRVAQAKELKKKLGITLDKTDGLLHEGKVRAMPGLSNISKYRQMGLIKPVGRAPVSGQISPFYCPCQIAELKRRLKK